MDDSLVKHVLVGLHQFSESADDHVGESIGQAEGMSDHEDFLADFQFVGITKLGVVMRSLGKQHVEQGAIGLPIASDQLSRNACPIMKHDRDLCRPVNHDDPANKVDVPGNLVIFVRNYVGMRVI